MSTERPAERSLCNSNRPRPPIARSPPSGPACRIPHRHAGDLGALGKRSGGAAAAPIVGQRGPPRGDGRSVVRPPAARSPAVGRFRDRQRWAVSGLFCNRSAWRSLLHDADIDAASFGAATSEEVIGGQRRSRGGGPASIVPICK